LWNHGHYDSSRWQEHELVISLLPLPGLKALDLEVTLLYVRFDDRIQVSPQLFLGRRDVVLDDLLESSQHGDATRVGAVDVLL